MSFIIIIAALFYIAVIVGSITLLILAINNRSKEKEREKEEHKNYKDY